MFQYYRISGENQTALEMEDAVRFFEHVGFPAGQVSEKKGALAYSLSKQFLIDEMENSDDYNVMRRVEFYEFIGRAA